MSTRTQAPAWRVLLGYIRPFRFALLGGAVLSLATSAAGLALPLVVRDLISGLSANRGITGLLVLMTVLVLANAGLGALGSFLLERTAESVVLVARQRLVSRLVRLQIPALDEHEPGDLMSRVSADTTLLREVSTTSVVSAVTASLTFLATITLMALLDPLLLGVTIGVLGAAQMMVRVIVPHISRASKQAQEFGRRDERVAETRAGRAAHGQGVRRGGPRARPVARRGARRVAGRSAGPPSGRRSPATLAGWPSRCRSLWCSGWGRPGGVWRDRRRHAWRSCSTSTTCCRQCGTSSARSPSTRSVLPRSPASARSNRCRPNNSIRRKPSVMRGQPPSRSRTSDSVISRICPGCTTTSASPSRPVG